ncbi:MAG: WD40 repeat domain-containing protein [Ruminococcaceae bacterium]|nr:WD40 repeat domain-containing protein [Oscillospiraceae bacterium]
MKKRALSLLLACFMVVSTFIISRPLVDVHAVEFSEGENQWTLPYNWSKDNDTYVSGGKTWDLTSKGCGLWRLTSLIDTETGKLNWNDTHGLSYTESARNRVNNGASALANEGWYTNCNGRWNGGSLFGKGDNSTWMKVSMATGGFSGINTGSKNPTVVFTAPVEGTFSYSELVTANNLLDESSPQKDLVVNVSVRKNGTVINSFTIDKNTTSKKLDGTVELMIGDELMFVFSLTTTDVTLTQTSSAETSKYVLTLSELVVKKIGELTTYPTYELPLNWLKSTDTDANGWATTRQGEWFLTHSGNLNGTASTGLRADWPDSGTPSGPKPWLEGGVNMPSRTSWYINPGTRWDGITIFNSGVEGEYFLVIPSASYNPSIVFTAQTDGEYEFSAQFNGVEGKMVDANSVAIEVLATANVLGEALDSCTVKDGSLNGSLEGTVVLKAGQQLVFTFDLTTSANIVNHQDFLHMTGATVKKIDEIPSDYVADAEIPVIFDGTSRFDVLGMVELAGYNRDAEGGIEDKIYTDGVQIKSGSGMWWLSDGTNPAGTHNHAIWKISQTTGEIILAGGHHNSSVTVHTGDGIGSALIFTAPYEGTFRISFNYNSNWAGSRENGIDLLLMDEDENLLDSDQAAAVDKKELNVTAEVTLAKGEKVYIVRSPMDCNASDTDKITAESVSADGPATLSIIELDHDCSSKTVKHIPATSAGCDDGNVEYWACACGAIYADAEATTKLIGATVIPGTGHDFTSTYGTNATQHWIICANDCGTQLEAEDHTWGYDGKCSVCDYACKHEGEISTPNCMFPGVCSVCKSAVKPTDPNKHVLGDSEIAYYSNGNGTHKKVTVCCKAELAVDEKCAFGTDNVCDKCGYESAIHSDVEDAFDNAFNGGNNDVNVTGPNDSLLNYVTKVTGTDVEGVEYAQFNIHHVNGKVTLRHHFIITADSYAITLNGEAVTLTNVKGTNIWYFDTTPVVGKYDTADKIAVNGTVTYEVSLYTYIRKALASDELNANQKNYLKALYDANEDAKKTPATTPVYVALANQRGDMGTPARPSKNWIDIYDITAGNMNTPYKSYSVTAGAISGFKFRNSATFGEVLLIAGAYDGEIISMETGETLWITHKAAQNAHSIELLPNGVLATASSAGNAVHLFNTALSEDQEPTIFALTDAHGVLWDPEYNVLWALGRTHLWALDVTINDDGTVAVVKNETLSYEMTMDHGHDLQPFYGNKDYLLVTGSTVMLYNKKTKTLTELYYEGHSVKGIGVLPDGDIVYIYPDDLYETWNSTWINRIDRATGEITQIHSNQGRFYKLRVFNYDYQ